MEWNGDFYRTGIDFPTEWNGGSYRIGIVSPVEWNGDSYGKEWLS